MSRAASPGGPAEQLTGFILRRGMWLIIAVVLIVLAVSVMARNLSVDNSLRVWFVEGDPALVAYDEYKREFGSDEAIVIAVTDGGGVYTPAVLERIRAASIRLGEHEKIRRVTSVAVGLHVSGEDGYLEISPLLSDGPVTVDEAAAVRRRVESNPSFRGTIANPDNDKITLIIVDPKNLADFDAERPALLADIGKIVDAELRKDDSDAHMGGIGVVYEGLNAASMRDTSVFVSLSYIVVLLGLWVMFRRLIWVGVGLVIVTLAIMATMGLAGAAGRDMNMVMAALPTLLMTIGILDLVHLVDAFEDSRARDPEMPRRQLIIASIGVVIVPCIFNTITDAIGFLALTSAHMSAIRDLGWLAASGLGVLLILVLVFTVSALGRFGGRVGRRPVSEREVSGFTRTIVSALFRVARDHRALVLVGTAIILAVSVVGIRRIVVDTYTIGFLPEDNPVRRDHRIIEREFGPYVAMEFTIRSKRPDGIKEPDLLRTIDTIERRFEGHESIARVTGLPEIVKRVNQIWNDEDPARYAIPESRGIVAEQLLNYGFDVDGRDHLDDIVTPGYQLTHITSRTGLPTASTVEKIVAELEEVGRAELGALAIARAKLSPEDVVINPEAAYASGDVELAAAGYGPLYVRIIRHITEAQMTSFALAFVLVTLVLMILLRSLKLGLLAMVPNLLPATMTLGLMGFVGISLDVATVVIAAIAIGISVNDTTHIMFRFRHELRADPSDPHAAVERMMLRTGRPVVASSLILMAGFAVLMFASVKSISYFGLLSSITIVSALVADLIITPALLLTVNRGKGA